MPHPVTEVLFNGLEITPPPHHLTIAGGGYDAVTGRMLSAIGALIALEKSTAVVATDSGGVQKVLFFYQAPCTNLRDETELVKLFVADCNNRLVIPNNVKTVHQAILQAQGTRWAEIAPYGSGNVSSIIVNKLERMQR